MHNKYGYPMSAVSEIDNTGFKLRIINQYMNMSP